MAATNRLPQVTNAIVTYVGDLGSAKWLSLIDSTLNGGSPCVEGAVTAASEDNLHSGIAQAASSTKEVTIPQSTLLSEAKTFALCYAHTDASSTDSTWRDSYMRVMISKMESLAAHTVTHWTDGHIARVGGTKLVWNGDEYVSTTVDDLELTYTGSLANNMYVSLVDETFNELTFSPLVTTGYFPCANGAVAAAGYDSLHSGVDQGSSSVVAFDTKDLSTTKTFAVCYNEANGTSTDNWVDSGIRLTVSKITEIIMMAHPPQANLCAHSEAPM
jgi:hypothetical protein